MRFVTEIFFDNGESQIIDDLPSNYDSKIDWINDEEAAVNALNKWNNSRGSVNSLIVSYKIRPIHESFSRKLVNMEKEAVTKERLKAVEAGSVSAGRPKIEKPAILKDVIKRFRDRSISLDEAVCLLGVGKSTFYRWMKEEEV